eukprot:contig_17486_g4278
MVVDIFSWAAACISCAQNRLMERRRTTAMLLFPTKEPFAALAMDVLGPLPVTEEGNQYILVICDRFTKLTPHKLMGTQDTVDLDTFLVLLQCIAMRCDQPRSGTVGNNPLLFCSARAAPAD